MMLHRHFDQSKDKNITTLSDVTPKVKTEKVSEPAQTEPAEAPKKRGRKPKTGE